MKRSVILILILLVSLFLFHSTGYAQLGFRKGVKIGYNWSMLKGDNAFDPEARKVLTGGASLEFRLLGLLAFQVDALYSPRGTAFALADDLHLAYISVPIVLKIKLFPVGVHPFLMAGPEFNYLLSAKSGDVNVKDQIHSQDLCIVAGAGLEFSLLGKSLIVEARYSHGLSNIVKENNTIPSELKHRIVQIYAGLLF